MTNLKLTVLAATATLAASIGGASALPVNGSLPAPGASDVQQVRLVCNVFGQCYDTRWTVRSSRYYAPHRSRYYDTRYDTRYNRHNREYDRNRGIVLGFGPFGIQVR
jgi:hypothetical protein